MDARTLPRPFWPRNMEIDCLDKRATSEHTHKEPAANNVPGVTRQVEMVSSVPSTDGDTRIEVPRAGTYFHVLVGQGL